MNATRILCSALLVLGGAGHLAMADVPPDGITRTQIQRHDTATVGHEALQVRVDFAPGAGFPRHSHPGDEIAYVLSGTLEYTLDGQAPVTLHAGEGLFLPAGVVHSAKNIGSSKASELATYVVEKGKPVVTLAD